MRLEIAGVRCEGVSTDTRTIEAGQAFVALTGDNHDGHDFVEAARARGAAAAVLTRPVKVEIAQQIVSDTLDWLQREAAMRRKQWGRAVVGVTGSAGKTTTKDAVAAALAAKFRTGKTRGNFNNHIGVPLSILNLDDTCEAAVLEIGMNHAGEIRHLATLARPQVAVVTNVGTAHIEHFDSIEGIALAKRELVESLDADGVAVLNWDDERVRRFADVHGGRVVSYGIGEGADVRAEKVEYGARGARFEVDGMMVACPLPARGGVLACLGALAVARAMGVDMASARQRLETLTPPAMRFERLESGGAVVWNDSYNSNPEAAKMMIDLLADTPGQRRFAVLGEMRELGRWSVQLHREVGEYAAARGIDTVVAVKGDAAHLAESARLGGCEAVFFEEPGEAGQWLRGAVRAGDAVLFKGSRGTKVEKALEEFMKV